MKNVRFLNSSPAAWTAAVTSTLALATILCTNATTARADSEGSGDVDSTNHSPAAYIVSPDEGAMFLVGTKIPIHALVVNFTDTVSSVEFFSGSNNLGTVTNFSLNDREHHAELATLVWSNSVAGDYSLSAVATDAGGVSVTSAPVSITLVTNFPPVVHIVKPANNSYILGPTNVHILASAYDQDGSIADVAFYAGTNKLGTVTNPPPMYITCDDGQFAVRANGYPFTWSNAPVGTVELTVVATDNGGVISTSTPVTVNIVTDLPPVVKIVKPDNDNDRDDRFLSPANIHLEAVASDPSGGSITNLEFLDNGVPIGTSTNSETVTNRENHTVQTYFSLDWNYVVAGTDTVTAVATDGDGESTTSAPVVIVVKTPPPPSVQIVNPHNGQHFVQPENIVITAKPDNFVNPIAKVTFLAGTNILTVKTNQAYVYQYHWLDVAPGNYSITVTARDMGGASATSAPVNITVTTNQSWMNRD